MTRRVCEACVGGGVMGGGGREKGASSYSM